MKKLAVLGAAVAAAVWVGLPITLWMLSTKMDVTLMFAAIVSTLVAWGFCWLVLCQIFVEEKRGG